MTDYTDEQLQAACQAAADALGNADTELLMVIMEPSTGRPGYRRVNVMAYGLDADQIQTVLRHAIDGVHDIENPPNSDNVH